MDVWSILAIVLGLVGIIGSVVPGLPGPPLSWVGLLFVYFSGRAGVADPMTPKFLFIWLAVVTVVTVLDYFVPAWFTKVTGGHKAAGTGAIIGLIVGLFSPVSIIVGALLGAFLGELLVEDKGVWASFKASIGAFLGFLCGTGLKLICSGVMFYEILKFVF